MESYANGSFEDMPGRQAACIWLSRNTETYRFKIKTPGIACKKNPITINGVSSTKSDYLQFFFSSLIASETLPIKQEI